MIRIEDIGIDSVRISMVGELKRPISVTAREWELFWTDAREGSEGVLRDQIYDLEDEVSDLRDRLGDYE